MGVFIIFRIQFKTKRQRISFIKKYKPEVLVQDNSNSAGFVAWQMFWEPNTLICFMGYAEPEEIKKELKGKIRYFDWIAINDKNSRWDKDKEKR